MPRPRPTPLASVTLRDGTPVQIRPIRPDDAPLLAEFHRALSGETVRLRYAGGFGLTGRVEPHRLADRCHTHDGEVILVGTVPTPSGPALVGVARLVPMPEEDHTAEFAVVVRDDLQGTGLGAALLRRLFEAGRRGGLTRTVGVVLPDNARMLRLGRDLGGTTHYVPEDGVVLVTVDLTGGPIGEGTGGPTGA